MVTLARYSCLEGIIRAPRISHISIKRVAAPRVHSYSTLLSSHRILQTKRLQSRQQFQCQTYGLIKRNMASFMDFDDELDNWPKSKANTILNICPQGQVMVIERLGKLHEIRKGGWFICIPFIDQIRFVVDMREKALNIPAQSAITKDNVHVQVSGNLYCQFVDAELAAYGSKNPIYAVKQHAQACMRAAIGEMELDEILHARAKLNELIKSTVQDSARAWGLELKRYEITTVSPDKFITEAMDKQAAAERDRRKKVLEAEGDKRSAELASEGLKIKMKNESEGRLIQITNEAEANKARMLLEGQGEVAVIQMRAEAQAAAIRTIADALRDPAAAEAAKLAIAREYIDMYAGICGQSNTMIFSDRPADVNALLAQASAVVQAVGQTKSTERTSKEN